MEGFMSYPKWWIWVGIGIPLFLGIVAMAGAKDAAALAFFVSFIGWLVVMQFAYLVYWLIRKAYERASGRRQ